MRNWYRETICGWKRYFLSDVLPHSYNSRRYSLAKLITITHCNKKFCCKYSKKVSNTQFLCIFHHKKLSGGCVRKQNLWNSGDSCSRKNSADSMDSAWGIVRQRGGGVDSAWGIVRRRGDIKTGGAISHRATPHHHKLLLRNCCFSVHIHWLWLKASPIMVSALEQRGFSYLLPLT